MSDGLEPAIFSSHVNRCEGATCAISRASPPHMPSPHDNVFVPEVTDSPEDPFGLFPSETQKPPAQIHNAPAQIHNAPAQSQYAVPVRPKRPSPTTNRQVFVLTIASLARVFAAFIAASRVVVRFAAASCSWVVSAIRRLRLPRWRLPAWRLPAGRLPRFQLPKWRLPAWHLPSWRVPTLRLPAWRSPTWRFPAWHLPAGRLVAWCLAAWRTRMAAASEARPVIWRIAAYTPLSVVIITSFASGVVVGGSAMWLSGASRHARAQSTASQQPPREVPRAAASPEALLATSLANTPVVQIADSRTAAVTARAAARRPQFRGSLVVNSRPSGARVFLNGRSVGRTPLVLKNQPAGSRAVRVDLDGYEPWSSAVQVVADTETRLRAELKMQRPSAQP